MHHPHHIAAVERCFIINATRPAHTLRTYAHTPHAIVPPASAAAAAVITNTPTATTTPINTTTTTTSYQYSHCVLTV
jgi:hypothetical protein